VLKLCIIFLLCKKKRKKFITAKKSKLLDHVRQVIRTKHYRYSTEKSYVDWIYRYIYFHNKRHPKMMGEKEISEFLTFLLSNAKFQLRLKTRH
jgi:hypothetical protein